MNIAQVMTQVPAGVGKGHGNPTAQYRSASAVPDRSKLAKLCHRPDDQKASQLARNRPRQPPTNTSAMASKQTLAFFLVAMLALASTLELASSFCLGLYLHFTLLGAQRLDHEHAQRRR